jgi:hypothetical protein
LVISVGANRKDPLAQTEMRSSGTGGFRLYGQTTLAVLQDLNTEEGCQAFGLSRSDLPGISFVPFRVHEGDDASCLNLNRAQIPTLLGVDPQRLQERKAFSFTGFPDLPSEWNLLDATQEDGSILAIADQNTIRWALHKQLGETLTYVDERGRPYSVRLVAALRNSILQGKLIISEKAFLKQYPSESGYRLFLVDSPTLSLPSEDGAQAVASLQNLLSNALQDVGLDIEPAAQRMATLMAVENTYLSIFQLLGGLGLILGSVGMGVLVLRNALERRAELALLRALGFSRRWIQGLILMEHSILLLLGLFSGALTGFISVVPPLLTSSTVFPYTSLSLTLLVLVFSGILWIGSATRVALRGPVLDALRVE